jgi:hypothetical protein
MRSCRQLWHASGPFCNNCRRRFLRRSGTDSAATCTGRLRRRDISR